MTTTLTPARPLTMSEQMAVESAAQNAFYRDHPIGADAADSEE